MAGLGGLEDLAARRRFGMKPGLGTIRALCASLGDPQNRFRAIHVAGTNGKGAVCAMLDACLREAGFRVGRYTSPHLVNLNERFFLDGAPVDDRTLERAAERVEDRIRRKCPAAGSQNPAAGEEVTFFEALTAVAFLLYAEARIDYAVLETGLGGRLDATNACEPCLCVITRIGLDHCDWLGDTIGKIAAEKSGIIKPGVPIVLGANCDEARAVVERRAREVGAPFFYAPDIASEGDVPPDFALEGKFNRENAVTAIAALRVMEKCGGNRPLRAPATHVEAGRPSGARAGRGAERAVRGVGGLGKVYWPGRYQRIGDVIVDGAHNPPAARALAAALDADGVKPKSLVLIAGFCGDKDVGTVLGTLARFVDRGFAVRTNNPRSLSAEETAVKMRAAGIDATSCSSLREALTASRQTPDASRQPPATLVAGSLFLAGEALVELGAYRDGVPRFDPAEKLRRWHF